MEYYEYTLKKQKKIPERFQINIDSLVFGADSIVMRPVKDGLKHFTVFTPGEDIIQTEFYVDGKTNFISRILYYYSPANEEYEMGVDRVDVYYKNISTAKVPDDVFRIEKFLKKENNQYSGTGDFLKYKVKYYNHK